MPVPQPPFDLIVADPPWNFATWSPAGDGKAVPYQTLGQHPMMAWDVGAIASPRAALAMWVTRTHLKVAFELAESWGFPHFSSMWFTWAKRLGSDDQRRETAVRSLHGCTCNPCIRKQIDHAVEDWWAMGTGMTTRANAEFVLGFWRSANDRLPRLDAGVLDLIVAPRQEHSRKPEEMQDRLERLFGDVPRAELFARRKRNGWACWGNQITPDFYLPVKPGFEVPEGSPVEEEETLS